MTQEIDNLLKLKTRLSGDLEFLRDIKRELQKKFLASLAIYIDQQKTNSSTLIPSTTVLDTLDNLKTHLTIEEVAVKLHQSLERTLQDQQYARIDAIEFWNNCHGPEQQLPPPETYTVDLSADGCKWVISRQGEVIETPNTLFGIEKHQKLRAKLLADQPEYVDWAETCKKILDPHATQRSITTYIQRMFRWNSND